MVNKVQRAVLPALCFLLIAGCGGPHLKDSENERFSLSNYDHVALTSVEAASGITNPGLSEDLATQIRDRLNESKSWIEVTDEPEPTDATKDHVFSRQVDFAVLILKARFPSRSQIVWLGFAHKMTCRLEIHDHATNALLGSVDISSSVKPFLGNAVLLNGGTMGILGRACFDTRKHDANSLLAHMAKKIVKTLDRAKEAAPRSDKVSLALSIRDAWDSTIVPGRGRADGP